MTITPNSDIYLLKVPFEMDNENELTFSNEQAQTNYFSSLPRLELLNATYQRKDGVLRYPGNFDDLVNYNYCMYKNESFSNKWYYAFIEDITFENPGMTSIKLKTDVFQTWQFDIVYKRMFVEREHVSNDTVGLHTVPENLELGEYISNGFERDNELSTLVYLVQATEFVSGSDRPIATNLGGVYVPGVVYRCTSGTILANIINAYQNGREEAILNIWTVPDKIVRLATGEDMKVGMSEPITYTKNVSKQTTLNGYNPKNKKLLTYPYNFLVLDNNNGTSNILQYENFSGANCEFEIEGVPTIGGSIKCVPMNYKGETRYQQEGIMCGKFPTCGWANDTYTNWLTQNAVNIGLGVASSGLTILGGAGMLVTGAGAVAGASSIVSGSLGIANTLGQVYQHSILPNTAKGNINGGDIATTYDMNKFYFIKMSIKSEYAQIIDDFFQAYGYKVNSYKIPNINGRTNWNFVKTKSCNIVGEIPQKDLQEIKDIFNNGVTLWHNPSTFLDYSQSNNII